MYKNILVPVSFEEDRNAKEAMKIAQALSAPDARITLMHVMEQIPGYAISYLPAEYLSQSRAAIEAELAMMGAELKNGAIAVVDGHSGRTILDWSQEHDVDCIVLASHRPGMQDYLLGSTAHQVVRHAQCAVHVLR